ncbi:condensin subunit ScpB [Onishia taeanensis]|uniref:Condensin subunit ScpB n=1 Tax=Onishia taeanensis TaxID=284577 RepID=A0A1G7PAG2_9GAMM|nr:SMC-Scp complex subunit ScpB [Halomonas taeanensis]SDF83263.1 condensin subunit ScpB [Halomonas taeanensis]
MNERQHLDQILEAALLAAGEPLSTERLESLFDDHERPARRDMKEALTRLGERLESGALELIETASGFQLRIRQRLSPWVSRLWDERPQRYSRALLETLALIAYRQPVTRGDIEEVRGVAVSSSIMRTLSERGWIRVVGQRDVPGRPSVYATTRAFLDDFGLKTLDGLPPMHELKDFEARFNELEQSADASAAAGEKAAGDGASSDDEASREALPAGDDETSAGDAAEEAASPAQQDGAPAPQAGATAPDDEHATAGMADAAPHAGKASTQAGLSFADLEARLAGRARQAPTVDDDGRAGTDHSSDETPSES